MSILKLEPGQKVQFTVSGASHAEGKFGPQIRFNGTTPDDADAALFLNVDTAEKQLGRIGFTTHTVIGQTVEIERVEKNGTKYTNINRASGVVASRPTPTGNVKQPLSSGGPLPWEHGPVAPIAEPIYGDEPAHHAAIAALTPAAKLEGLFTTYERCFDRALAVATKNLPAAMVTHEGVAAQAATLFIQASQRGIAA